ncbi:histone-lysine N-methyltransferase ASHR3 [Herrania umbratica]|uniref:Histone-lysine N-methyltransferase ASHR3 n=1 Tax=Herrania umbratica TaxID=108875 RepID=A0A6J0ZP89_9ROSI|nr:histone-lysine N-methyltransferase ASHR3 [Herrania umbratica]
MPDLGNLSNSSSLSLSRCPHLKLLPIDSADTADAFDPGAVKTLALNCGWAQGLVRKGADSNGNGIRGLKRVKKGSNGKVLGDYLRDWVQSKMESGIPESRCVLPFLVGAKKSVECLHCYKLIYPGEEVLCSVRGCQGVYHKKCAKESFRMSNPKKFQCPQHVCFVCRQRTQWRCVCCTMASHNKCAPWPDAVNHLEDKPGRAICWRHPTNWRLDKKHAVPATEIEEIFCQLPLPYKDEEFKLDLTWKDLMENKLEPPPYVHIKRNVYLVKKKRDDADDDIGCTSCSSTCSEDCVCRLPCSSICSKACHCPETCNNRPFRKEKRIRIVKTELCGWGVEAAEPINKGDFVIEYIGEVIDDAQCEKRLWDMKYKGVKNFYMCEIRKDFTIDATFKGNTSRFLNHGCDPNCVLEKWQVEGETRVGVFAARSIEVGEPLTYDYRFVQFGPEVKCYCGASNCQGYLGTKRKIVKLDLSWGSKRRRSSTACLAIITV